MFNWLRLRRQSNSPPAADLSTPAPAPMLQPVQASPPPRPSNPTLAQAEFQRASQALSRGQIDEAERHLRSAIAAQTDHADALGNLGALLRDSGRKAEAAAMLERAVKARPRGGAATYNLALLRIDQRRWADAVALLRTAATAMPKDADVQYWLGNATMGLGDALAARKAYQSAVRLAPGHAAARWGLTMAQLPAIAASVAEQDRALRAFGQELGRLKAWFGAQPALDGSAAVGAQQPYYLAYIEQDHHALLADYGALCAHLMARWARRAGVPAPMPATAPGEKRRIGIVSSHVHRHSVWNAILRGWVEHLDPAKFELHLFHTGGFRDGDTEWAAKRVAHLHQNAGDWRAWAKIVSDSRLDAIVYPEIGMESTTLRLASLRLARLQLAAWGHPLTTGLPTIDGYVSAAAFEPADALEHYTEHVIALPRLGCCYTPYGTLPEPPKLASWGIEENDRLLLCAGTPFKYTPQYDALWIDIARRCTPCKLLFFRQAGNTIADALEQRLRAAFGAAGVNPDHCLRFVPWQSQQAFFGLLDRADVFLDTPGFSGFNTAMQAVERGTPIVAYEGRYMRGRFASGILREAGLEEWVADTQQDYAEHVERLCRDPALRARVRLQMTGAGSSLYGDRGSVAALGAALDERLSQM